MAVKFRDYYEVLGVPRGAPADEIKAAYRRLARKHHPDLHHGKAREKAEEAFKEINEAHAVLSDPEKRARYDQLGPNWKAGMDFTPPPGGEPNVRVEYGDLGDMDGAAFSDFFASLFGRARGRRRSRQSRAGRDIETEIAWSWKRRTGAVAGPWRSKCWRSARSAVEQASRGTGSARPAADKA